MTMETIRYALISACDTAITIMAITVGLAYVFRWPMVAVAIVSILAKAWS